MAHVEISPDAEMDLADIWFYISHDSERAADRMLRRLSGEIHKLADSPGMGVRRDQLAKGLRSWPSGAYLVFYRVAGETIQIVRVLHGARSLDDIFGPPGSD